MLLFGYNDGRKMTLFCIAVNILDLQISLLLAVPNNGIEVVNMIVFFRGVYTALKAVFYSAMLHAASCNFASLVSFTAAARTVFIQKHGTTSTI